ncbi:hypothetical protein Hanom_Chr04g00296771 [Helianthus anomalus]
MGVSGKWIRALIGLKKHEKSQSPREDGHVSIYITSFFPMQLSYIICMLMNEIECYNIMLKGLFILFIYILLGFCI